jgi:hypothetical protein
MLNAPAHSPFGASSAHRWMVCPGSIRLQREWAEKHGPPEDSPWAKEGTAAHALAAQCFRDQRSASEIARDDDDWGKLDSSVIEGVQLYVNTVERDWEELGGRLDIETKFGMTDLHSMFWGTSDAVLITPDRNMVVYDLKMGRGQIVEVRDAKDNLNAQLAFYALGALHNAKQPINRIELVLVQPRAWHRDGPVRRTHAHHGELHTFRDKLLKAAAECERPDAKLAPGSHCRFCSALAECPAVADKAFDAMQLDYANPSLLGREKLAEALTAINLIEEWIAAVRAHAHVIAAGPEGLPGWKLVDKQGRRRWIDEIQAARELRYVWGLDDSDIFETSLRSPAQIEKLLLPELRKSMDFRALCPSVSLGKTLVRADNPHPEATRSPEEDYTTAL